MDQGRLPASPADRAPIEEFRRRCAALGLASVSEYEDGSRGGDAPAEIAGLLSGPTPEGPVSVGGGRSGVVVEHRSGSRITGRTAVALSEGWSPGTGAAASGLRAIAEDLVSLRQGKAALAGFTEQLSESYDTIDLLYSVGRSMKQLAQPRHFLREVCERLQRTMSFAWVAAMFEEEERLPRWFRGQLIWAGEMPLEPGAARAYALPLVERAEREGVNFVSEECGALGSAGGGQVLVQPLNCKGEMAGVLLAGGKGGSDPRVSSYDIQLVEAAAGHIDAFTENAALLEDQHLLFMGTVQAMTAAIDAKDRYTFGHSERVAHMAEQLGLTVGLSAGEAERLRITGLVHDVGKIGVPEAVLTKPGKLTEDEFAKIKLHPEIGFRILRDIPQLGDVLPGVLHHHERYDGKGYPHGLAGEEIPLCARIMAVADTFDAMSSNRSYRPAMAREKVLSEIERCAGSQLDPRVAGLIRRVDLASYDAMVARHARVLVQAA